MAKPKIASFAAVESRIYVIRGQKVMLDRDLAELYGVTTGNLNKAVSRNRERFPADFVFQIDNQMVANLKFQIGISSSSAGFWRLDIGNINDTL